MTKQTLQSLILVRGIKNKVFVGYEEDGHGTRDPVLYRVGNVLDGGFIGHGGTIPSRSASQIEKLMRRLTLYDVYIIVAKEEAS